LFSGDENFFFCFVDVFLQAQTLDWGPTMRITPTRTMATLIAVGLMRLPSKKGFAIPPHCLSFDDAGALQF
jgi:hypothetical protein